MAEQILIEARAGRVARLVLNRPESLNALSPELSATLLETIERLDSDQSVGVVVITGAGRAFCAGGDIKGMAERAKMTREERLDYMRRGYAIPLAIRTSTKVFVALINGVAAGGGLAIAAACDIKLAARSARFGAAFSKIGLAADFGSTYLLTKTVGPAAARQLLLSADVINAERALHIGLVDRLVDDDALGDAGDELARQYAEGPSLAYRLIKENLIAAESMSIADSFEQEARNQVTAAFSADHLEAAAAFIEKRKPVFRGN
jgi:2-(1,2-epoxy-1,2-dihydrophenyl)acetyl-CoA isomerase